MRRAKVDANHAEIVKALRQFGVSVVSLAAVGRGCPDLLCGYHGRNVLLEVKDGKKRLLPHQGEWQDQWQGPVVTVRSVDEAIQAVMYADERERAHSG
jgi:hypothetical protein